MIKCVEPGIIGRRRKRSAVPKIHKIMAITTDQIPTITIDELSDHITSGIGNDVINWGTTLYTTTGTSYPNYGAIPGGSAGPAAGYAYTTNNTSPWISSGGTGLSPTMAVNPSGTIEIKGEDADIKINGKSMVTWMEAVEERLNILTPNPELEAEWDELQELGERYRALEKKCREKAQIWAALKKVQPRQP